MRFYNFRFTREEGFSTANWYAPSLNNWRQDRLPFIDFKLQLNKATYNRLKFRVANLNFTFLFGFETVQLHVNDCVEFGADVSTEKLDRSFYTLWRSCGFTVKEAQEGLKAVVFYTDRFGKGRVKLDNGELHDDSN